MGLIGCHARQRIARECRIQTCVLSVVLIGRQRPETSARTFGLRSFCSVSVLRGTYLNRGAPGAHLQISSSKEETCAAFYKTHSGTASAARAGAAAALRRPARRFPCLFCHVAKRATALHHRRRTSANNGSQCPPASNTTRSTAAPLLTFRRAGHAAPCAVWPVARDKGYKAASLLCAPWSRSLPGAASAPIAHHGKYLQSPVFTRATQ